MLLGMGSVFIFLIALVLALKGMSRLAQILEPEEVLAGSSTQTGIASKPDEDEELLAVISAAIARYRSQHK
jgi:oxaloacetate decarboxylase (Na+ extruding) subunit gamma